MSFLENSRYVGFGLELVAVFYAFQFLDYGSTLFVEGHIQFPDIVTDQKMYALFMSLGGIIVAALYFMCSQRIEQGSGEKVDILADYVKTAGTTMVLNALFGSMALFAGKQTDGIFAYTENVILFTIGLIAIFFGRRVNNGNRHILIWFILILAFVMMFLFSFLILYHLTESFDLNDMFLGIAYLIISIFILALLTNEDVREQLLKGRCRISSRNTE